MSAETTTLPNGSQARLRIHRTGSVEATVGGRSYQLDPAAAAATSPGPVSVSSPGSVGGSGRPFVMGELSGSHGGGPASASPGAAYLGSSGLAHSVLAHSSFSSNVHNSRAVLAALRALQDKIRTLEADRSKFSHQCGALQVELTGVKEKLADEQGHATAKHEELQTTAAELAKRERDMEIEKAERSEKMSALATEMAFVKEQAQVAATERRSAVDAQARLEVALGLKEQQNQELREELAREQVLRRTAEERVAKLNELADRLLSQNQQQAQKIARRPRRRRVKAKKKASSSVNSNSDMRPKFGSRGKRVSKLSRTRQEAADRERSQARSRVKNNLSLKEQVRLANMGKDPPFMPSGNPREEFNVYGVTQKQLSDPMAYGNARKVAGGGAGDGAREGEADTTEARSPSGGSHGHRVDSGTKNVRSPTLMSERSYISPQHIDTKDRGSEDSGGLGAVIHAIRDEFNALTLRRNTLLQNAAESPDGHLNIDQRTIDIALADLQTKIQSKKRQLDLLEDQQRSQQELNEASLTAAAVQAPQVKMRSPSRFSPQRVTDASERKQAALDLLRHYKETTQEQEFDSLNELHGRSLAAGWVDRDGDVISSQRRGTYFGTYSAEEASKLRSIGRTSSSLGVVHNSLRQ